MCIISDQSRRHRKSPTSGFGCFPQVTIPSIPFKPVSSSFARPQTFIKVLIVKVLFLGAVSVKAWKTVSRHLPSGPHIPIQSSSLPVYRANPKNFVGFIGKMVGCIRRSSPTCFLVLCNEFSRLGRLQGNILQGGVGRMEEISEADIAEVFQDIIGPGREIFNVWTTAIGSTQITKLKKLGFFRSPELVLERFGVRTRSNFLNLGAFPTPKLPLRSPPRNWEVYFII
ncbi:hypothetical protein B0H11DRAFT_2190553 [Mycena galericulata]|nr:hypothetical protein B0H11DRAFT_2190553 [Mycena galericulata]